MASIPQSYAGSSASSAFMVDLNTPPSYQSTPETAQSEGHQNPVPFSIEKNGVSASALVPQSVLPDLERIRDEVLPTFDDDEDSELSSPQIYLSLVDHASRTSDNPEVASALLRALEQQFLRDIDIHTLASRLGSSDEERLLKSYYSACESCNTYPKRVPSALFQAAASGNARVCMAFGGQGAANAVCLKELADLNNVYGPLLKDLFAALSPVLEELSSTQEAQTIFNGHPFRLRSWLKGVIEPPPTHVMATAPYSFPIIGILGLANYVVTCRVQGLTPGEMRSRLGGATGHSQGIAVAAAIAVAGSWEEFFQAARYITKLLFWVGFYSHRDAPATAMTAQMAQDAITSGEGKPSYLLSVRGLQRPEVERVVKSINKIAREGEQVYIALQNTPTNFVLAGPSTSLCGVSKHLRTLKAGDGDNQAKTPFNKRKPKISHMFLPVSAPFHTPYLAQASADAKNAMSGLNSSTERLAIPVFHTKDGCDLRHYAEHNVGDLLIDAITQNYVDWPASIAFRNATHIVSYGSGRIGDLIVDLKQGSGIRTIFGHTTGRGDRVAGRKSELFNPSSEVLSLRTESWADMYAPRIQHDEHGNITVSTKLTRTLKIPHVVTAGMTPTTVPWDFVAAIMNAGYHAELAGGGYYNAEQMSAAIKQVIRNVPAGRGITCNVIYSSPKAMAWQIPMFKKLMREGVPVDGLAIGAGVPSPEIATEYITSLGLKHITLKPGSHSAIRDVIKIAAAHPDFPVMLQWTGGRGGGHHSYEDIDGPMLDLYAEIRKQNNIILMIGSGFGGAEDSYHYLSGEWSVRYNRPLMPFDGVLLGSRMMVAAEAHTSLECKRLICEASGTSSDEWMKTYDGPAGGIITVKSEMGQPIHKIATRGVMFWAEMDKIFALPREKMIENIRRQKSKIIAKLNADFAKPYFGRNIDGKVIDLGLMTYGEIIARVIELMYVRHQDRWVHKTYQRFVKDIVVRSLERTRCTDIDVSDLLNNPHDFYKSLITQHPILLHKVIDPDDETFFLQRCKTPGQKPVNFVPVIDQELEHWMKKDSLWQSEDIDAVIGRDPQRVCILQGPVAARYSTRTDQSAKDILDEICNGHTKMLQSSKSSSVVIDNRRRSSASIIESPTSAISNGPTKLAQVLEECSPAIQALCREEFLLRGQLRVPNNLKRVLDLDDVVAEAKDQGHAVMIAVNGSEKIQIFSNKDDDKLCVRLFFRKPGTEVAKPLELHYNHIDTRAFYKVEEVNGGSTHVESIKDFYKQLWMRNPDTGNNALSSVFNAHPVALDKATVQRFVDAIAIARSSSLNAQWNGKDVPMDVLISVCWDVNIQPLLQKAMDSDLLSLVHLSNSAKYVAGAAAFRVGDIVSSTSKVTSLTIESAGRRVEVQAELNRGGELVAIVTSAFLYRGSFSDYHNTFESRKESQIELIVDSAITEAVLRDRSWFEALSKSNKLVGKTLVFDLETKSQRADANTFSLVSTNGSVYDKALGPVSGKVATVSFESRGCSGNAAMDYLTRKGELLPRIAKLSSPGWHDDEAYEVKMPVTNEAYSIASRDCNPIHTSAVFAAWTGLPGTITHGMYTSAIIRSMVENIVAGSEPRRFHSFSSSFTGMVLPGETLALHIKHVAMNNGDMVLDITASNVATGAKVLEGEAVVEQPSTTYIFTGQGSQAQNMGMDLYNSSPAAKKVWDDTDKYLMDTYGFSILDIVRNNPKSVTVHFGGKLGRRIRSNYLALTIDHGHGHGPEPILSDLTPTSTSYTFSEPRGLLFSTQFAQPAILLVARAAFENMRAKSLIPPSSSFAGHSLGEYGALSAFTDFMPFPTLMNVVFYRGLTMQNAMDRDEMGRTDFSMVAINPKRVGRFFSEETLREVLKYVATKSNGLMEIVNFNVKAEQYVCAGHLRNIHAVTLTLNHLHGHAMEAPAMIAEFMENPGAPSKLVAVIDKALADASALPKPIELSRGSATIPLKGIDVPFHSTYLRPHVQGYRNFLESRIVEGEIDPEKFIGKFIPNVMATPFKTDREYFSEAARLTGSEVLKAMC